MTIGPTLVLITGYNLALFSLLSTIFTKRFLYPVMLPDRSSNCFDRKTRCTYSLRMLLNICNSISKTYCTLQIKYI